MDHSSLTSVTSQFNQSNPQSSYVLCLCVYVVTLSSFQCEGGGFGGGPQQLAHCAPTYASVLALLIIGTPDAYNSINRCIDTIAWEEEGRGLDKGLMGLCVCGV